MSSYPRCVRAGDVIEFLERDNQRLHTLVESLAERVQIQSELLTRSASRQRLRLGPTDAILGESGLGRQLPLGHV